MVRLEKILEDKPIYDEKITKLNEIFVKGDDYDTKINVLYKSISERKKEIDELYYEIIGYTETDEETDEETKIIGKKDELENAYNQSKLKLEELEEEFIILKDHVKADYDTFQEKKEHDFSSLMIKWTDEYSKVLNTIEELLPRALTTGLSYAYSEKKEGEEKENLKHSSTFKWAITGLVIISLIPFILSINSINNGTELETVILRVPRLVLAILPLYIPILWVAYSSNRKMNLSKRLIEEYTHKEVLSKTFEGLSKQINNIDDKSMSSDLRTKLLYNILEVNSENPGKLISDYNKSDHPLMDALDKSIKLTNAVTKLAKIPGFSKMAATLEKKSKEILAEEAQKADAGLEAIKPET